MNGTYRIPLNPEEKPVAVAPVAEPKKRRGWFVQNCLGRSVWVEIAA